MCVKEIHVETLQSVLIMVVEPSHVNVQRTTKECCVREKVTKRLKRSKKIKIADTFAWEEKYPSSTAA